MQSPKNKPSLPSGPCVTDEDVRYIVGEIRRLVTGKAR